MGVKGKFIVMIVSLVILLLGVHRVASQAAPLTELRVCASGCPYTSVQAAVNAAGPEDVIQIAAGLYTGLNELGGLSQMVYITQSLTLIGGYSPDFSAWNPDIYTTTLDAEAGGRVIYASGTLTLTLSGLHLANGNASGLGGAIYYDDDAGGAVYVNGSVLQMTDCIVENSLASASAPSGQYAAAGGGLYIASSPAVTLTNNLIQDNIAATVAGDYMGLGGGLALYNSRATLAGNTIRGNIASTLYAGEGGGLKLSGGTTSLQDNTIAFNIASQGTMNFSYGEGGGIFASGNLTMTGNTITDNNAGYVSGHGGGVALLGAEDFVLTGNHILRNTGSAAASEHQLGIGGGLYLFMAEGAVLTDNLIQDNVAGESGGGLYLDESTATLTANIIQNNFASVKGNGFGGGLYLEDSPATLTANQINGNTAMDENIGSAGIQGSGGGLYLKTSNATLSDNHIQNNRASITSEYGEGRGGGLYLLQSQATLTHNQVIGNLASRAYNDTGSGGGLYIESSHATLAQNLIDSNTAGLISNGYGGGVYIRGYHGLAPVLDGNVIVRNTASFHSLAVDGFGGGIAIYRCGETQPVILRNNLLTANDADDFGSGLWVGGIYETQPVGVQLSHNTIADNRGGNAAVMLDFATPLEMTNTILSGHNLGVYAVAGSGVTLNATLWYLNDTNTGGAGNIVHTQDYSGDPRFADPAAWNYHLAWNSAARDLAVVSSVSLDLDGQSRPNPDTNLPDLGADEFYYAAPESLSLSGPLTLPAGWPALFTAQVTPPGTTLPLTYTWEASGQAAVIHQGGLSDTLSLTWPDPGEQHITLTAANAYGAPVTITYTLTVTAPEIKVFLPVVAKN